MSPSVSKAQHAAMEAAAHGKSTLGIPKQVAEEFVEADAGNAQPGKRRGKFKKKAPKGLKPPTSQPEDYDAGAES